MPSPASALRRRCTGYRINIGRKEGHVDGGGAAAAAAAGSVYDPNQTSKKCTVGLLFPHDKNVLKNPGAYKTASSKQTKYMLKVKMRLMFFVLLVSPLCEETSRRMKAAGSDYTLLTSVPRPSVPAMPTWISFPARPRTPRSL